MNRYRKSRKSLGADVLRLSKVKKIAQASQGRLNVAFKDHRRLPHSSMSAERI